MNDFSLFNYLIGNKTKTVAMFQLHHWELVTTEITPPSSLAHICNSVRSPISRDMFGNQR